MSDIIFESLRGAVFVLLLALVVRLALTRQARPRGWAFILGGFVLLTFSSLIDITDNFPELNPLIVIGDTEVEAFLEKVVGSLGGAVLLSVGLMMWLADIRKVRAEREAEAVRADSAMEIKADFLANMSHELRTPLNAILGFSDVIRQELFGPIANAHYAEYVDNIHRSGSHLLELINDVLDLSKVEAGKMTLTEACLSVDEVVEDVFSMMRPLADERRCVLVYEPDERGLHLEGDPRRVRQVLLNLLSNAVKFTGGDRDGRVTVAARSNADGGLTMAVSDDGIGMAADDIPRALEAFTQVHERGAHQSPETEGTGLGLPLVKRLMDLHDGGLDIASELGRGTTVTVTFPPERVVHPAEIGKPAMAPAE